MKHLFFDLDGTITESRQLISEEMKSLLKELINKNHDIIVTSGAERERMLIQLDGLEISYLLPQSGADFKEWAIPLQDAEKKTIIDHVEKIKDTNRESFKKNEEDLLQDRGMQMTFSFTGHNAPIENKKTFDPNGSLRIKILEKIPFINEKLEVRVAGSTCLDYTRKDSTKGKNIERLIKLLKWDKKDCIYFGDALFKGGNDETVCGVIETIAIKNPIDLIKKLKML